jgi:hypothetical protein
MAAYERWEDAMVSQVRLYEFVNSANGRTFMDDFQTDMNAKHPPGARLAPGFLHAIELATLGDAEPIWVSGEMTELVDHARHEFEPESVQPNDPFVPRGFALLAAPIRLLDSPPTDEEPLRAPDGTVPIRAVAWTAIHSEDLSQGAFWLSLYMHLDDRPDLSEEGRRQVLAMYGPMVLVHAFQMTWGRDPMEGALSVRIESEAVEETRFRARQQGQLIQTLWRLASQFVPVKRRAPRQIRRDAARRLGPKAVETVNVVTLRRAYESGESEPAGRSLNVTFLVQGYWAVRHFREGPRQVWVRPHLKGRGPFKETTRAWEFRR